MWLHFYQKEETIGIFATRSALILLIFFLTLSACSPEQTKDTVDTPVSEAEVLAVEQEAANNSEPADQGDAPEIPSYNACEMLTQSEIETAAFRDFPSGEGVPCTDAPFLRGETVSCRWEVGDHQAQFHERLYLYNFSLDNADPAVDYEDRVRRLSDAEERSGIGERAAFAQRSGILAVQDGNLVFLIRIDLLSSEDIESQLTALARQVLSRK